VEARVHKNKDRFIEEIEERSFMELSSDIARPLSQTARTSRVKSWLNGESLLALAFILPSLIGFTVFFAIPLVRSILISFTEWNMMRPAEYIGLENYQGLLTDTRFHQSLLTTLSYVLLNIPLQTILALVIAAMIDRVHNSTWLRGIIVLPWLIPNVIVALLWLWILDPTLGIMNSFLGIFGIARQPFLGSPEQALPAIAGINIWRHTGYTALLIFAGLKTIPRTLYEAAAIDGANEAQIFRRITLPLLRPVLTFVLVTSVIGSFQIFDTISITTEGGPVNATRVILWYIYEYAFVRFDMGYAAAIATVLFVILTVITIIQFRFLRGSRADVADYT
jgi:multiple sugar transport system permease protein